MDKGVSIVMPYYERAFSLEQCLINLVSLYGSRPNTEVIIVDDGSIKEPAADVFTKREKGFGTEHLSFKCIYNGPPKSYGLTPCVPLNIGIRAASKEIILLQNPETIHSRAIIDEMLESLGEDRKKVICAAQYSPELQRWYQHSVHRKCGFHFCNLQYKSLLLAVGLYDEQFRECCGHDDTDMVMKLCVAGADFVFRDDLITYHHSRDKSLWKYPVEVGRKKFFDKWKDEIAKYPFATRYA